MARYRQSAAGWVVDVAGTDIRIQSRSLPSARLAAVQALADARGTYQGAVVLADDVALPARLRRSVTVAAAKRRAAEQAVAASTAATEVAARTLIASGLSLRDAGYLLGLSHARVKQMIDRTKEA